MQTRKNRNRLQLLFISMVMAFVCASCTKEDNSNCDVTYTLTVRAFDADNNEVSDRKIVKEVSVYVFDSLKNYLNKHDAMIGQPLELSYPDHDSLHVVVWGNSTSENQKMPDFKVGDAMEKGFLSLITTKESPLNEKATLPIAKSPDDLFYGSAKMIKEEYVTKEQTIPMYRKTASVIITARKLREYAAVSDDNFSYVVRKSANLLDFYGKPNGMLVSYAPLAAFDDKNEFVAPIFNILTTTSDLAIEIYHYDVLLITVYVDSKGQPLRSVEGKLLNVLIDFGADIDVSVSVTPWGKEEIWKEFN